MKQTNGRLRTAIFGRTLVCRSRHDRRRNPQRELLIGLTWRKISGSNLYVLFYQLFYRVAVGVRRECAPCAFSLLLSILSLRAISQLVSRPNHGSSAFLPIDGPVSPNIFPS